MTKTAVPVESRTRSIVMFFSGNLAASALSIVAMLLITRWTPPQQMGLWNFALLISTYSSVLQCGVFNGLNRQLPFFQGRGDDSAIERVSSAALALCIGLTVVTIATTLGVALVFAYLERTEVLLTTLAIGTIIGCSWGLQYLTVTYSASMQFSQLARKGAWVALLGLPLALLTYLAGFAGLLLRAGALAVLQVALLWWQRPIRHRTRWQPAELLALAKIGFPIWVVGQLTAMFMTLDRLVLADSLESLGYYSIAAQFAALSTMVPTAFNAVYYSQMAREYGSNHQAMALWRLAKHAAIRSTGCSLALGLAGWGLIPPFITYVLPAYVPGIPAAQWALFAGVSMAFSTFGNIFNVLRRQEVLILSFLLGLMAFMGAWYGLTEWAQQSKLVAAAQSMLFGTLVASVMSALLSLHVCRHHDRKHAVVAVDMGGRTKS